MALTTKKENSKVDVNDGDTIGIITQIIDLGNQFKRDWNVTSTNWWEQVATYQDGNPMIIHEIIVGFELPLVKLPDGRPAMLSKRYTVSTHEKAALTKLLVAAAISSDDLVDLVGKRVVLTIGHTSGGFPKITDVRRPARSFIIEGVDGTDDEVITVASLVAVNPHLVLEIEEVQKDISLLEKVPTFMQELIINQATKEEYESAKNAKSSTRSTVRQDNAEDSVDEIPY